MKVNSKVRVGSRNSHETITRWLLAHMVERVEEKDEMVDQADIVTLVEVPAVVVEVTPVVVEVPEDTDRARDSLRFNILMDHTQQ